ncbi:MAG: SprT family zinc-dependent metalloprotease [Clostridia bacterium]|nr:SprT family zinc-dependent metalloprotease [Clostridia bacterium]
MKRAVIAGGRRVEYTLIQSNRANVLFQALPEAGIRVYAPKYLRLRDVDEMVRERAEQLTRMQREVEQRLEDDRRAHPVTDGSPILIEGRRCTLRLHAGSRRAGRLVGDEYHLTLPEPDSDAAVRAAIRSTLSAVALKRIRQRLEHYAPRVGAAPGRVTIREQKSRWGSCSRKGNLNFNWKLIMAPPEVLDYVVIHELCHLHEFNHSPRFWALVEAQMPEYEAWKKWLKVHAEDLYL